MIHFASYYPINGNAPLNHARILYAPITGTVTAGGTDGANAANDYTHQRWLAPSGAADWTLQTAANAGVDCVFIAAHNMAGAAVTISTSDTTGGAFVARATFTPTDNSTICVLFNLPTGAPVTLRRVKLALADGTGVAIGIIRAGVALQMQRAFYAGHTPANFGRVTEAQQQFSETGQWLGRLEKRRGLATEYSWNHLTMPWYQQYFDPFAKTLPLQPFGIAGNPARMSDDVAWGFTSGDVKPETMGIRDMLSVNLPVMGYR